MSLLYPDFLQIFVISPHVTHAIAQDLLKDASDYATGRACLRSGARFAFWIQQVRSDTASCERLKCSA
jgi:hypothetical protein